MADWEIKEAWWKYWGIYNITPSYQNDDNTNKLNWNSLRLMNVTTAWHHKIHYITLIQNLQKLAKNQSLYDFFKKDFLKVIVLLYTSVLYIFAS